MNKVAGVITILMAIIIVSFIGISSTGLFLQQEDDSVKIGVVATLTGIGSYFGEQEIKGLELAQEEINKNGGINGKKIELIIEDSKTSPLDAVNATKKLIYFDQVNFIVGDSWGSTTGAMVPVTNDNQVLLISPSSILDSLSNDDLFFRTVPTTSVMMEELANYAYDKMRSRKVGALISQTAFGEEHINDFKHFFKGEIVAVEMIPLNQLDVRAELMRINELKPDTIFNIVGSGAGIGNPIRTARELGIDYKWIGSFGVQNNGLIEEHGNLVDGIVYPYHYNLSLESTASIQFNKKYEEKYNELSDVTAVNAYDTLMLLAKAIGEVGEDPQAVKEYLLSIENYEGASGNLSFDENGDVKKPIIIKTIKNGEFVLVE